MWSV